MRHGTRVLAAATFLVVTLVLVYLVSREPAEPGRDSTPESSRREMAMGDEDSGSVPDDMRLLAHETDARGVDAKVLSAMRDRYGQSFAMHRLNPRDLEEGERAHLGVYLERGGSRRELGVTSLGPESYANKKVLAVAITDGATRIERWDSDGNYTGQAWDVQDDMKTECATLEWADAAQAIQMTGRGTKLELGTTANGWSVVLEFWKFRPANS